MYGIPLTLLLFCSGAATFTYCYFLYCLRTACTARYGFLNIAEVLLAAGANPLLLDCYGNTPLDLAAATGSINAIWPCQEWREAAAAAKPKLIALLKQHTAK